MAAWGMMSSFLYPLMGDMAPRYISTPFCIWVSKPVVADGGGSGREVGLLCCYGRWYITIAQ